MSDPAAPPPATSPPPSSTTSAADLGRALAVLLICGGVGAGLAIAVGDGLRLAGTPVAVWIVGVAFALNGLAFVGAAIAQSERFYDLTGSLTFLSLVGVCVAARIAGGLTDVVGFVPLAMVAVWTARLGWFLVSRIAAVGNDGRFDEMKTRPARFVIAWTLQALWCAVTFMPAAVLAAAPGEMTPARIVGWAMWVLGFGIEVVADGQKSAFRKRGGSGFINEGLWRWSRHPNYAGEILLWLGLFVSGVDVYVGGQWLVVASPILVFVLLVFISGIPLLEARADARFADDPAYAAYKAATPVLLLRPPRRA